MNMSHVAGLHIGTVEACSPTEIKIFLDYDAPQDIAFNTGRPQGFPRLNGYVLIPNEGGPVVAVIARMAMEPAPPQSNAMRDRGIVPIPVSSRRLFVVPVGTLETRRIVNDATSVYQLHRGVASFPAVGDAVVLPTSDQLRAVVEASGSDRRVRIGSSRLASDAPVTIDPDKLFGRHVGVFGNTGSGKSCTVAGLIRWSIEAAGDESASVAARFVVLDPNGEYRTCFNDLSSFLDVRVFSVEPQGTESPLIVPAWMWNGQEWAGALSASPGAQRPVLMQTIRQLRAAALVGDAGTEPEKRLLLATQLRALHEYFQGCRAEGVAALGNFPRFQAIHQNLAGMEAQLLLFQETLTPDENPLLAAAEQAINASRDARGRRTVQYNGRDRIQQFQDADIAAVVEAL